MDVLQAIKRNQARLLGGAMALFLLLTSIALVWQRSAVQAEQASSIKVLLGSDADTLQRSLQQQNVLDFLALTPELIAVELKQNGEVKARFSPSSVQTIWPSESRMVVQAEQALTLSIWFRHPVVVVLSSPFGGLIMLFLLAGAGLLYRQRQALDAQLSGLVCMEKRAKALMNGELVSKQQNESPEVVSQALDMLVSQIQQAQQERSRFDQFIRDSTFTDMESGFGNRRFFDNRLEAALKDGESNSTGVVYLVQLQELDLVKERLDEHQVAELVAEFSDILSQLLSSCTDAVIARRSSADFAALVPNLMPREVDDLANKMLRGFRRLALPDFVDRDCFFHIGVANFIPGDEAYQVLSEADMALRAAQLQGPSCWYMYDHGVIERGQALGSVRWRALLENAISRRTFVMFTQSAVTASGSRIHHHEVLTRVRDDKGQLVNAGVFLPMASRCGLLPKIDRIIIEQLIKLLEYEKADTERCSVNLSCDSLLNKEFMSWLVDTLKSHPKLAHRMIIEIAEYHVTHHQAEIREPLRQIQSTGCQLLVDRVGQTVVGSQYINDLSVDYLKLDHSVVREIQNRPENQLFVRSLSSAIGEHQVNIFALGVETDAEWRTLKNLGVFGGQGHYFSESLERVAECTEGH
ncbi:EAL domain-containing protein [Corallincola platygyrae]|uniref:EAL domain-containing protein n=1 Tax=Corallincola platygyrae TaxID=1193278 RepID=A0ABW4XQ03_9GAMM